MADPVELAKQHDEAFAARDADVRRRIESPDIHVVMPGGLDMKGHDAVMQVVRAFWQALPDGSITVDHQLRAGDTVVTEGVLGGTHAGPFPTPQGEIPPSGNRVSLRFASVKRFEGDRLVSERLYFDQLEFMQQIGAMPS